MANAQLAQALVGLMSPQCTAALARLAACENGLPTRSAFVQRLQPYRAALGDLIVESDDRCRIINEPVRLALQKALAQQRGADSLETRIRQHLMDGHQQAAIDLLTTQGGAFHSMTHGLDPARRVAAAFSDADRASLPLLVMLDAVNALKSGNTGPADALVNDLFGRRGVVSLGEDISHLELDHACFLFVRAVYEDLPLGAPELEQLFATLSRVPSDDSVQRGLLYNVALDVFVRRRDWAMAEETALRALHHFQAAGVPSLSFYIQLYLAVIALAVGNGGAIGRLEEACETLTGFSQASPNDQQLLTMLTLIARYENGDPAKLVHHLMTRDDSVPYGELWPAIAAPILAYGSRALRHHATHAAALSWVRRWRVQQWRSHRFERLIALEEVTILQSMRRWQEADELLAQYPTEHNPDWALVRQRAVLEKAPRSTRAARALAALRGEPGLTATHIVNLTLLRAQSALARGAIDEVATVLTNALDDVPIQTAPAEWADESSALADILADRAVATRLRRKPRLWQLLRGYVDVKGDDAPGTDFGLTRQEGRVLALIAEGLPNKVISTRLGLAEVTVKFHVGNILRKLGCKTRLQAAEIALGASVLPS